MRTGSTRGTRRSLLAPEVVQTSAIDCGPATLKCLLEGFGIHASYGRLREACQTDVDGTSVSTLERIAISLGLQAEQRMYPKEDVLVPEAGVLPALTVVRLPDGATHFVVLWRMHGPLVQVMDPAVGRTYTTRRALLASLFTHEHRVPAADWRAFTAEPEFRKPLGARLARIGLPDGGAAMVARAESDGTHKGFALLDAAARMVEALVGAGGLARGREAERALEALVGKGYEKAIAAIPRDYWSVTPADRDTLLLRGAIVVRILGRSETPCEDLSPELKAAIEEPPQRPWRELLRLVRQDGLSSLVLTAGALSAAAVLTVIEAIALRGLIEAVSRLPLPLARIGALGWVMALAGGLAFIELPVALEMRRLGRHLESRLRIAFLAKLPRLPDRYFRSRPVSDMAARSHTIHVVRQLPDAAARVLRLGAEMAAIVAGIAWLSPGTTPVALACAAVSIVLPLLAQAPLRDRDLRVRTHAAALSRIMLDALQGLVALRTHAGERSIRREHEKLLTTWADAGRSHLRALLFFEGTTALFGLMLACAILADFAMRSEGGGGSALLLLYWALALPSLGQEVAFVARQYPGYRNVTFRLLEPLGAPEAFTGEAAAIPSGSGVAIDLRSVKVIAGGHVILTDVTLSVPAGAHVAIVGSSGAGKSSLVGLLLGWHRAAEGSIEVEGLPLSGSLLGALRSVTAWVDPELHLWNRTLLENLLYGAPPDAASSIPDTLRTADLEGVLKVLPEGLQTPLGEGGGLVSGGEGQRVRLGRALGRAGARLAILDEPFRGLGSHDRRELLSRARRAFARATLLCVTHDVADTTGFPRVIVVDEGRIVEDGDPAVLAAREGSRYAALLSAERGVWESFAWKRWLVEDGRVLEEERVR